MRPTEKRDKVKRLKEKIELDLIMIRNYERDRDRKNYEERIAKQKAIVLEAEKSVAKIRHQRKTARGEISKIKQSMRYSKRQLVRLRNSKNIELLLRLVKELRKETDDGETDSDT